MSNLSAPLPVMAGEDMPAGPTDPIFNRLLKDRIIWMGEEVKDEMANRICAQMLMLAAEDPKKDIWLYINSPGGSITAGMAIYDTMQLIEPDVATVGLGMCASMGQFLLSSGTKGKRLSLSAVIFALVAVILVFAKFNNEGFQILWRYFAWSNQTLSLFAFLAITVWMFENGKGKYAWMPMIPGGFYCFICSTYIANAKIGFNIPWTYAYIIGVAAAVLYVGVIIWYGRKRAAAHTLQH